MAAAKSSPRRHKTRRENCSVQTPPRDRAARSTTGYYSSYRSSEAPDPREPRRPPAEARPSCAAAPHRRASATSGARFRYAPARRAPPCLPRCGRRIASETARWRREAMRRSSFAASAAAERAASQSSHPLTGYMSGKRWPVAGFTAWKVLAAFAERHFPPIRTGCSAIS